MSAMNFELKMSWDNTYSSAVRRIRKTMIYFTFPRVIKNFFKYFSANSLHEISTLFFLNQ